VARNAPYSKISAFRKYLKISGRFARPNLALFLGGQISPLANTEQ